MERGGQTVRKWIVTIKEYEIYYFEELTEQEKTKLENSKNFKGLKK